jgi:N-acylglucosamine-6-phosphate 2-epimerase
MSDAVELLRGGLVVSCQAYAGEPMRHPETMAQLAEAACRGGAVGIRTEGTDCVALIRERLAVTVIGLWKDGASDDVFITPTLRHALAVARAGSQVVAVDGTRRSRPDGLTLAQVVDGVHTDSDALVMADCGSLEDAVAAADGGADVLGTTLAGYTGERHRTEGPDLELISAIAQRLPDVPLLAEGRVHTPAQARQALDAGAFAVVVGTAITHPTTITGWFVQALET